MATSMLTNKMGLPQPFVDAATSNHVYKPNRYSVTDVLGGTCEAVLKRRHVGETDADISDMVWAIFGTAVHKVLEEAEPTSTQEQEKWLYVPVDGYELSGIIDLYDSATETVTDWKTTSVWSVMFKDYETWRLQLLLYCWMLRQNGLKASRGEIVAILRDHSMRRAKAEPDYPKHPVMRFEWDFGEKDFESAEALVRQWFGEAREQEQRNDEDLMPCSPEQRWAKPRTWAVKRPSRKRAVRVFEDEEEAVELLNQLMEEDKGAYIEVRQGEDVRCDSYCPVAGFCPYAIAKDEGIPF